MADSRIKDATGTVVSAELSALLNTLYLAVDATSFTDFKKVLFKTLLTEAVVSANTNNYQAMTPKSFYDSIMTTTRKGIGQLATDTQVTDKEGTGLLNSVHQTLMQAQWLKDWFQGNGAVAHYEADLFANESASSFDVNYYATLVNGLKYAIGPSIARNHYGIYYSAIVRRTGDNSFSETYKLVYAATDVEKQIGTSGLYIGLLANGTGIYLRNGWPTSQEFTVSIHFNTIQY